MSTKPTCGLVWSSLWKHYRDHNSYEFWPHGAWEQTLHAQVIIELERSGSIKEGYGSPSQTGGKEVKEQPLHWGRHRKQMEER